MGVSAGGHTDPHLHAPCPRCGYATRYKQWPTKCACSDAERQKATSTSPNVKNIWAEQEAKNADLRKIDHSHIRPLHIADRYVAGSSRTRRPTEPYDSIGD
jgi:hypothetical protein